MQVLVTGSAGFIGFHLARRLLSSGHQVLGFDALTPYYDVRLKQARHSILGQSSAFVPVIGSLENADLVRSTVRRFQPELVLHFAAQAGVRYSLDHPDSYLSTNAVGTFNLLEALRTAPPRHLLAASSSSVYGANSSAAFRETERTDFPLSIYAATKSATESMAHSYAHLFGIPTTMARLFTVYGPWGRPDMAAFRFAAAIERGDPIDVYGSGRMSRDFTYIDDLVEAIARLIDRPPVIGAPVTPGDSLSPVAPWRTVNVAGGHPVSVLDYIAAFETAIGRPAIRNDMPMQPGDVASTHADVTLLGALVGYVPAIPVGQGVAAFVDWYRNEWPATQT